MERRSIANRVPIRQRPGHPSDAVEDELSKYGSHWWFWKHLLALTGRGAENEECGSRPAVQVSRSLSGTAEHGAYHTVDT